MNLKTMTAVNTGLDAAYYFLRIGFLLMLAFRADDYEYHAMR
jgi:hypothetical protein